MSDFSGNPFADPENVNPFADPAVTAVTTSPPTDDYNPFADQSPEARLPPPPSKQEVQAAAKKPLGPVAPIPSTPAVIEAQQYQPPPEYTQPPPAVDETKGELTRREKEMQEKEAALAERERNLNRLGRQRPPNNFPPLPAGCPIKPCFYHDITSEIPPSQRWIVRCLLGLWIYTVLLLCYNLLVAICGAISSGDDHGDAFLVTMGFAIAFFVLFIPGSLVCWYIPVYRAYRSDSSLSYMWFFFVFFFQVVSFFFNCIGFPKTGGCGFWIGALAFGKSKAIGAMFMISGILWAIGAPISIVLLIKVHRYYRSSGASLEKAQKEAFTAVASNQTVRDTAKKAAVSAATNKDVQQAAFAGIRTAATQ